MTLTGEPGPPRADLLALSDAVLADLTNRGTLRRARREVDEAAVRFTITTTPAGAVLVTSDDDVACELTTGGFDDWLCSCLAGSRCRHLVRAVLAYRAASDGVPDALDPAGPPPPVPFWPGAVTDEALGAALTPAARRRAAELARGGSLGLVAPGEITTVRLFHPVAVTVRFLVGADLGYVRCDCRDPDPCAHVVLAVELARSAGPDATGTLITTPGDTWQPDAEVLAAVRTAVDELIDIGVDAGHRVLPDPLRTLGSRCRGAELFAVAEVLDAVVGELERYRGADAGFSGAGVVDLLGELLARVASLTHRRPDRVPDRLVAGAPVASTDVIGGRLVGLGTELVEHGSHVLVRAVAVDLRSGAAVSVSREHTDPDPAAPVPAAALADRPVAGVPLAAWGGGQVLTTGGTRTAAAEFRPGRRRASALPAPDLAALGAPYAVPDLAALARGQTRLPAVLDQRTAGTGLAACRFVAVHGVGFDPATQQLVAALVDAAGATARVELPYRSRCPDGVDALAALLAGHLPGEPLWVSGRWRFTDGGPRVTPMLVTTSGRSVQPQVTRTGPTDPATVVPPEARSPHGAAGAVLTDVGAVLEQAVVAGCRRLARDTPDAFPAVAARCRRAGAHRFAALVDPGTPPELADLILALVLARPLL